MEPIEEVKWEQIKEVKRMVFENDIAGFKAKNFNFNDNKNILYYALIEALEEGRVTFVEEILKSNGADSKSVANYFPSYLLTKWSPLLYLLAKNKRRTEADYNNAMKCLELLLYYGADVNFIYDHTGETPLYFAVEFEWELPALQLLVNNGGDVTIKKKMNKQKEILDLLVFAADHHRPQKELQFISDEMVKKQPSAIRLAGGGRTRRKRKQKKSKKKYRSVKHYK